jgi:two-component system response regulator YesN
VRIAIVDDESVTCEGLASMIAAQKNESWRLTAVFNDSEEALETCDWDDVDLLLADINMPGMSGLELVESLRDRGWDTLVIIISGYAQFEYARKAMINNAVDFIIKPVASDKLFSSLRKAEAILAERSAERSSRMFIQSNMARLVREYFSEIIFETRMMTEEHKSDLFASFGLAGKRYELLVFLSDTSGESMTSLMEETRLGQEASLYWYSSGSGLYTVLAICGKPDDFSPEAFRALAEQRIGSMAWCGSARTDSVDSLNALHMGLLRRMRDAKVAEPMRPLDRETATGRLPSMNVDYAPPVLRALRIIQQDFAKPLSLTILSDKVCVHPTYLSNLFKKQTGLALIDYINHYRVEEAKKLLEDPLNKIYWVSEQVGFVNQRYFSQVFKKISGLTPVEYRSNCYLHGGRR